MFVKMFLQIFRGRDAAMHKRLRAAICEAAGLNPERVLSVNIRIENFCVRIETVVVEDHAAELAAHNWVVSPDEDLTAMQIHQAALFSDIIHGRL